MIDCCSATIEDKICIRKKDSKQFKLPRKYSKKKCTENKIKGFSNFFLNFILDIL